MLNQTNKNIALQIANIYCQDALCKESLNNRLNLFFDDQTFPIFLSQLNSKHFEIGSFSLPLQYDRLNKKWLGVFSSQDVVTGVSGSWSISLPNTIYNPGETDWKKAIEYINAPYISFVKIVGDKILYQTSQHGGYGIAYTTNPTSGGETGGGSTLIDPERGGGGSVYVPTQSNYSNAPGQIVSTSNFNLNDLIIPGVIVLGFFLLKDKF